MASRSQSSGAPSTGPVFAIVGLLAVLGFAVAMLGKQKDKETKAEEKAKKSVVEDSGPASDPFGDVTVNTPASQRKNTKDLAPPGLAEEPRWVEAAGIAGRGRELVDKAVAARLAGDEDEYRRLGIQGRELLFEGQGLATDFYLEMSELYPEDRQVEALSRKMKPWGKALKKVRHLE